MINLAFLPFLRRSAISHRHLSAPMRVLGSALPRIITSPAFYEERTAMELPPLPLLLRLCKGSAPLLRATRMMHHQMMQQREIGTGKYTTNLPSAIDWREKGAVTSVKNQLIYSTCYAFAAIAALEGIHKIRTGNLVAFSVQDMVNCGPACFRNPKNAFIFIMTNWITTEFECPYVGVRQPCNRKENAYYVTIDGCERVESNEKALMTVVASQPVVACIDASEKCFKDYTGGVYDLGYGPFKFPNHCVVIVGYETAQNGEKIWILKNSWGTAWGEKGYMRILSNDLFRIVDHFIYPIINSRVDNHRANW